MARPSHLSNEPPTLATDLKLELGIQDCYPDVFHGLKKLLLTEIPFTIGFYPKPPNFIGAYRWILFESY